MKEILKRYRGVRFTCIELKTPHGIMYYPECTITEIIGRTVSFVFRAAGIKDNGDVDPDEDGPLIMKSCRIDSIESVSLNLTQLEHDSNVDKLNKILPL